MSGVGNLPGRVGSTNNNTYYDNRSSQVKHNLTKGSGEKTAFIKGNMKDSRDDVQAADGNISMQDLQGGYGVNLNSPAQEFNNICKEAGIDRWSGDAAYAKLPKETLHKMLEAYEKAVGSGSMSPNETLYQRIRHALNGAQ